jgi:hypothetical protein
LHGIIVIQVAIQLHQVDVKLDAIERALYRIRGQVIDCRGVFPDRLFRMVLHLRDLALYCVQSI